MVSTLANRVTFISKEAMLFHVELRTAVLLLFYILYFTLSQSKRSNKDPVPSLASYRVYRVSIKELRLTGREV